MKKIIIYFAALTLLVVSWNSFNLIRNDEESLRKKLLLNTPITSSFSEVEDYARKHDWKTVKIDKNSGFYDQRKNQCKIGKINTSGLCIVGKSYIEYDLGHYKDLMFFITSISAFYGFDENNNLIEIWVWKTTDSI